ncbi:MAG TPA: ankyrin repeat domain-containing protein [Candidatus Babeliales bacterium]|nr:ankyrin repeat domain-containing protein [Candidatus Babeliales bacterium]
MNVYTWYRTLLAIIINLSFGLSVQAGSPKQHANKRVQRIVGHMQSEKQRPIVEPSDVGASLGLMNIRCKNIKQGRFDQIVAHREIAEAMLENEAKYGDTYFVVFHAQWQEYKLLAEFLRHVYGFVHKRPLRSDFEYLRFWGDGSDVSTVNDYLDSFGIPNPFVSGEGQLNDNRPDIAQLLLSTNSTLFSNYRWSGECTWDYFMKNRSGVDYIRSVFSKIFERYEFNPEYIQKLLDVAKELRANTGDLLQIFIPKDLVNTCAYLSKAWGVPVKEHILDTNNNPILDGYDNKRMRYTESRPILEILQTQINKIKAPEDIQLRLFFSKTGPLLNPSMGLRVFRFTTLSAEQLQQYKNRVKKIAEAIFAEKVLEGSLSHYVVEAPPRKKNISIETVVPPIPPVRAIDPTEQQEIQYTIEKMVTPLDIFEAIDHADAVTWIKKFLVNTEILDESNDYGQTPLLYAVSRGKMDVVLFLIQHGARVDAKEARKGLMIAIQNGNFDFVRFFVEKYGADVNEGYMREGEPILAAAALRDLRIIEYLVKHGARINVAAGYSETTPLMEAAKLGLLNVVQFLVRHGADVHAYDDKHRTALMYAVIGSEHGFRESEYIAVIKLLKEAGLSIEDPDKYEVTPLMIAAMDGNLNMVQFLLQEGATFDVEKIMTEKKIAHSMRITEIGLDLPFNPGKAFMGVIAYLQELQRKQGKPAKKSKL